MENVKEIPYGVSSFVDVMEQNMYYVDKTMFLPLLEKQPRYLFFIRPRRFGKSLFIDMLRSYYDSEKKDQFQNLFGSLWIGSRPTPLQGRYQVLYLDFSHVGGDISSLEENFNLYCRRQLDGFMERYIQFYSERTVNSFFASTQAMDKLSIIDVEAKRLGYPLYLIIDEYDNFTNVVLNEKGEDIYHALTHASGFYRDVFKKFKGMFERIFMTGVSPVTLDDLTSGFNIGWNISTDPQFNRMLGFSEVEVREMFRYYQEAGQLKGDIDAMVAEMKPWYDNYCFSEECLECDPRMFNSDMVLYYLRNYITLGRSPKNMIDPNTRTDYGKMQKLIRLDKLDENRKGVLFKIAEEGQITTELFSTFPAKQLTDEKVFPSLLFYYGMLTIIGTYRTQLVLGIPNNNVRKQYYEYLLEEYQSRKSIDLSRLTTLCGDMAYDGHWKEALEFIAHAYAESSSVRSAIEGERNIQGFFTAYLSMNPYYLLAPEMELNHGFCDMFLMPDLQRYDDIAHSYILELKYLPVKDYDTKAEAQWAEAVEQIKKYAGAPRVCQLVQHTQLHCIVMQFKGWELMRMEEIPV